MKAGPRVTVLMPVFNGARFLRRALASLLEQSMGDFEILLVDDGSTDDSADIAESLEDDRLTVLRGGEQGGVVAALEKGLVAACAPYVARLDADDICEPRRLERQLAFMEANPGVDVLGSSVLVIDEAGRPVDVVTRSGEPLIVEWHLLFGNYVAHPSVMCRLSALLGVGGYRTGTDGIEDFDLWTRVIDAGGVVAQLEEPLVRLRRHSGQVTRSRRQEVGLKTANLVKRRVEALIGKPVNVDVAGFVGGAIEFAEPEDDLLREALRVLEECADRFMVERASEAGERRRVVLAAIPYLSRVGLSAERRMGRKAVGAAVRLATRHAPEALLSPSMGMFAARAVSPRLLVRIASAARAVRSRASGGARA